MTTIESDISNYLNSREEPLPLYTPEPSSSSALNLDQHDQSIHTSFLSSLPSCADTQVLPPILTPPNPRKNLIFSLFTAIQNGQDDVAHHILTHNPTSNITPNTRHPFNGETPLGAACKSGHISLVSTLLNLGADINLFSIEGEYYPLQKSFENNECRKRKQKLKRLLALEKKNKTSLISPRLSDEYNIYYSYWFDGKTMRPEFHILRTPLMIAAERGYLAIVKMLLAPPCNADDGIIAPDGQIALRLAVTNGHREIVEILPSRRGGGWKRFKHEHVASMLRIMEITETVRLVVRHLVWDLPNLVAEKMYMALRKLVVEMVPAAGRMVKKGMVKIGKEVARGAKWVVKELPGVVARNAMGIVRGTRSFLTDKLPGYVREFPGWSKRAVGAVGIWIKKSSVAFAKSVWKFFTKTLPKTMRFLLVDVLWKGMIVGSCKLLWRFIKWLWRSLVKLVTVKIPKVTVEFCKLVKTGVLAMVGLVVGLIQRILSLGHTCFEFIVGLLKRAKNVKAQDVVNAVMEVGRFLFVTVPKGVWKGVEKTYMAIVEVVVYVFGCFGWFVMSFLHLVLLLVGYLVGVCAKVVAQIGRIVGKGVGEVRVWFDPKSGGR